MISRLFADQCSFHWVLRAFLSPNQCWVSFDLSVWLILLSRNTIEWNEMYISFLGTCKKCSDFVFLSVWVAVVSICMCVFHLRFVFFLTWSVGQIIMLSIDLLNHYIIYLITHYRFGPRKILWFGHHNLPWSVNIHTIQYVFILWVRSGRAHFVFLHSTSEELSLL